MEQNIVIERHYLTPQMYREMYLGYPFYFINSYYQANYPSLNQNQNQNLNLNLNKTNKNEGMAAINLRRTGRVQTRHTVKFFRFAWKADRASAPLCLTIVI